MTIAPPAPAPTIRLLTGAASVPADEWNRLAHRGSHLHRWSEIAEACGWQPRHTAIDSGGSLSAIIPAYLFERTDHDLHDRWLGPLRKTAAAIGLSLRPTLTVGAPFIQSSDILGDWDALSNHTLNEIFQTLESQAKEDGARAVVWPFVDAEYTRLRDLARARGYIEVYAGASAFLPVKWDSFEDYLASRSKSVRRTIRGELREIEERGLRTELTSDFRRHKARMAALYSAAFQRRNGASSVTAPDLFQRLAEQPESGLLAALTWRGTELVGSSINLVAGRAMDGTFAAFTPEFSGGIAYYNDLIYEPLRYACRMGITSLELGPTALYPKVLRGATLRRRMTLVRGTNPLLHAALRVLGQAVGWQIQRKERPVLEAMKNRKGVS